MVESNTREMDEVIVRNVQALVQLRRRREAQRSRSERAADAVTKFAGSMASVLLHAVLFGGWLVVNSGVVPFFEPFDPFPFVMLAMFASVEAIFLATFVLISQNRQSALAEERAELDLQVNLITEHELTKLSRAVQRIGDRLEVQVDDLTSVLDDIEPSQVMEEIERGNPR